MRRLALFLTVFALSACGAIEQADKRHAAVTKQVNETLPKSAEPLPRIAPDNVSVVNQGVWLGDTSVRRQRGEPLPEYLDELRGITLVTAGSLSLPEIARQIAVASSLPVRVSDLLLDDASASEKDPSLDHKIKLDWSGSMTDLLNHIAASFGVDWEHIDGGVRFYRFKTQSFTLAAMPGTIRTDANVNSGVTGAGGATGANGTSSSGGSGSNTNQANSTASQQQTTDANANIQFWTEMKAAVENIVKGKGSVTLSEATGTVTVRSTPTVLRQIASFVTAQNESLSRQVSVSVAVYSIATNQDDQTGVDINAIIQNLAKTYAVNLAGPLSGLGDPLGSVNAVVVDTASRGATGRLAGSSAFLRALSTQGTASLVTTSAATTLNGQPVPISVVTQTSYLAQVTVSQTVNAGTLQSLVPGTVTTGFNLTFLPRILDNGRLAMRYTIALSDLRNLRSISSGGQTIQVPEVDQRTFLQHVMMRSGESLVLAGFEQNASNTDRAGVGDPGMFFLGGRKTGGTGRTAIVLVITPNVLPAMNTRRPGEPNPI